MAWSNRAILSRIKELTSQNFAFSSTNYIPSFCKSETVDAKLQYTHL